MEDKCVHCNVRIVKKYYALGAKWVHQPAGSAFNDFAYEFCKLYVAEPDIENLDKSVDEAEGFFERVHDVEKLVQKANEKAEEQ